jgi:hypothetical protein
LTGSSFRPSDTPRLFPSGAPSHVPEKRERTAHAHEPPRAHTRTHSPLPLPPTQPRLSKDKGNSDVEGGVHQRRSTESSVRPVSLVLPAGSPEGVSWLRAYWSCSRKEVIQPQVPLRLPCYDFAPVIELAFGRCPPGLPLGWHTDFGRSQLPWRDGRCVQGPGTDSPWRS